MRHDSDVQDSQTVAEYGRFWFPPMEPTDPTDIAGEIFERITLDIRADDFAFLKQWALFQNVIAKARLSRQSGSKSARAQSRKSLAEQSLHSRLLEQRAKMREMFDTVGPFPSVSSSKVTPDEMKAMVAYVNRVLALDKKSKK